MRGNEYVQEFINITGYLIKSQKVIIRKGFVLVPMPIVEKMLQHNNYDTVAGKIKIWKTLRWIDSDKDKTTKKVLIDGKSRRVLKLDITIYQTLAYLFRSDG